MPLGGVVGGKTGIDHGEGRLAIGGERLDEGGTKCRKNGVFRDPIDERELKEGNAPILLTLGIEGLARREGGDRCCGGYRRRCGGSPRGEYIEKYSKSIAQKRSCGPFRVPVDVATVGPGDAAIGATGGREGPFRLGRHRLCRIAIRRRRSLRLRGGDDRERHRRELELALGGGRFVAHGRTVVSLGARADEDERNAPIFI